MKNRYLYIVLILFFLHQILPSQPEKQNLPVSEQIKLILTTLKYDNHFMAKLSDELNIAVYCTENEISKQYCKKFLNTFQNDFKDKTFFERPFQIATISDTHALAANSFDLVIISPGSRENIREILEITHQKKIISATGNSDYLKSGVSIIVGLKEKKTFLAINLKNAQNEDCDFSSRILKLAQIVD